MYVFSYFGVDNGTRMRGIMADLFLKECKVVRKTNP
jgi:hypothetical protein